MLFYYIDFCDRFKRKICEWNEHAKILMNVQSAAIDFFEKYYKGKVFLPKDFKNRNHIEEIKGRRLNFRVDRLVVYNLK